MLVHVGITDSTLECRLIYQAEKQRNALLQDELSRMTKTSESLDKELRDVREHLRNRETMLKETFDLVATTTSKLQDAQEKVGSCMSLCSIS